MYFFNRTVDTAWGPSALAPGHQYPECQVYIHAFPVVYGLNLDKDMDKDMDK